MPDYDPTLYSLWNTPSGGNMMGYETENDASQGQHQQVQPPLYMMSDDELKMDSPQLSEFNQDLDSYLNDAMETGGPSPTTPLGSSTSSSKMKMDNFVTTDRRTGTGAELGGATRSRETQLERLLAPPPTVLELLSNIVAPSPADGSSPEPLTYISFSTLPSPDRFFSSSLVSRSLI
ncbi:hypothetical protein P3T76_006414 [Phytophthora citrophthora]|uniref:Uncharacterized protein n=1 Tax=Phytophthora citrophthora TaxID=4793 RepID=A0AAD9GP08_9STRA|nr:hypothetical protein P3T76_006414 [Phytophthora citrophthora]